MSNGFKTALSQIFSLISICLVPKETSKVNAHLPLGEIPKSRMLFKNPVDNSIPLPRGVGDEIELSTGTTKIKVTGLDG